MSRALVPAGQNPQLVQVRQVARPEPEYIILTDRCALLTALTPEQTKTFYASDPDIEYTHPERSDPTPLVRFSPPQYADETKPFAPEQVHSISYDFRVARDYLGGLAAMLEKPPVMEVETGRSIYRVEKHTKPLPSVVRPGANWQTRPISLEVSVHDKNHGTFTYRDGAQTVFQIPNVGAAQMWRFRQYINEDETGEFIIPTLERVLAAISKAEGLAGEIPEKEFFQHNAFPYLSHTGSLRYTKVLEAARRLLSGYRGTFNMGEECYPYPNFNRVRELQERIDRVPKTYEATWDKVFAGQLPALIQEAQKAASLIIHGRQPRGRVFMYEYTRDDKGLYMNQVRFLTGFGTSDKMPQDSNLRMEMAKLTVLTHQLTQRGLDGELANSTGRVAQAKRVYDEALRHHDRVAAKVRDSRAKDNKQVKEALDKLGIEEGSRQAVLNTKPITLTDEEEHEADELPF